MLMVQEMTRGLTVDQTETGNFIPSFLFHRFDL
jgi:hypothetical protein